MKKGLSAILAVVLSVSGMGSEFAVVRVEASENTYGGTYGSQLENDGNDYVKTIYDTMVEQYIYQSGDSGNEDGRYTGMAQPVENSGKINLNISEIGVNIEAATAEQVKSKIDEWVSEQREIFVYASRAAFDAFAKDFPQVYWLKSMSIQFTVQSSVNTAADKVYGNAVIKTIFIKPAEFFAGASGFVEEFNDAVLTTVNHLTVKHGIYAGMKESEVAKYVHDYLADTLNYNVGVANGAIYTPLAAFLKNSQWDENVVCQGYAKAFKILCDKFGVENALLTGKSINNQGKLEQHMWNAVRVEDGKWYAVDVSWDDQQKQIYYNYFLSGQNSKGFKYAYKEDHFPANKFSDYSDSKQFVIPQIAEAGYNRQDNITAATENGGTAGAATNNTKVTTSVNKKYYWTISGIKNVAYTGKRIQQKITIKCQGTALKEGKDYKLSYRNNMNVGKATIVITPIGKFKGGNTLTESFHITKVSIAKASATKIKTYRYKKGKAIKPVIKLKYKGKILKKGKDYKVTYKKNKQRGTAQIIITGKGNFKGTKKLVFRII